MASTLTPDLAPGSGAACCRSCPSCKPRGATSISPSRRSSLFYHDGTERAVQRPLDPDEQAEYYSGKKKCHTIKNILLIDGGCVIRFLSATYAGKWHDKALVDEEAYQLPIGSSLYQDMGFQGFAVVNVLIQQPTKKPRGGELTADQKAENRRIARQKMRIEHTIGSVKRCRLVTDKLRYWQDAVRDMVMAIAAGLHNLRLRYRPWHYETC